MSSITAINDVNFGGVTSKPEIKINFSKNQIQFQSKSKHKLKNPITNLTIRNSNKKQNISEFVKEVRQVVVMLGKVAAAVGCVASFEEQRYRPWKPKSAKLRFGFLLLLPFKAVASLTDMQLPKPKSATPS